MIKPKKNSLDKKPDVIEEPAIEYTSKSKIIQEDVMAELLDKLIKKGIEQCERGETMLHEVVMTRIKQKFNLPL